MKEGVKQFTRDQMEVPWEDKPDIETEDGIDLSKTMMMHHVTVKLMGLLGLMMEVNLEN